ncbi:MAG TPA: MOSC domain-containing protein [Chthoniobacteraceae bacterium]|jgi:MOSC domain-containing protein YiiM|nr:molybdenum cofactor biosysynthesis protein [Chthoniobacter sp.]HEV7869219.1 MOSC domain-containing protein [Chthoniobacteraceae bacterium]
MTEPQVLHLYISSGHNFFGHTGRPPSGNETVEVSSIRCVAGKGIEGDRFFSYKPNYKGQITFFAAEIYESLARQLRVNDKAPSVFRRNVITRGVDLNELIGAQFRIQDVLFEGTEECRPCYWMNEAFHPEAEQMLRGHGGLRARILTDGPISVQ